MFTQVISTLFDLMIDFEYLWKDTRYGSIPINSTRALKKVLIAMVSYGNGSSHRQSLQKSAKGKKAANEISSITVICGHGFSSVLPLPILS
jgi:hypothetical protein